MKKLDRIVLVIACLVILGLSAACQPEVADVPVTATDLPAVPTLATTLEPTPGAEEAQAAVIKALLSINTQPNRMESTTTPDGGQPQSNIIEFAPPDRKHITSPADGMEYIVIGQVVYAKTPSSGAWQETQIPASTFMGEAKIDEATLARTVSEAQFVRRDVLDGQAVLVYRYASTTRSGDIELHSQTELWLGEADGLPHQMVISGEILSASTDPASGESKLQAVQAQTITRVIFDPAIRIEAPDLASTATSAP